MTYKELLHQFITNPDSIPATTLSIQDHARTYLLHQRQPVIVKITNDNIEKVLFHQVVLQQLKKRGVPVQSIQYVEECVIDSIPRICIVLDYLPGTSITSYPDEATIIRIIDVVYELSEASLMIDTSGIDLLPPSIAEIAPVLVSQLPDCYIKRVYLHVEQVPAFMNLLQRKDVLFHGDLWKENILLDTKQVSIIDFDPIIFGAKNIYPAHLFSAYFLFSSILFKEEQVFDLEGLISLWPTPLDKTEILYLMLVFPLFIGMIKEINCGSNNCSQEVRINIMAPLEQCIQYILDELSIVAL